MQFSNKQFLDYFNNGWEKLRFVAFYISKFTLWARQLTYFQIFSIIIFWTNFLTNNQFSDKFNNGGGLLSSALLSFINYWIFLFSMYNIHRNIAINTKVNPCPVSAKWEVMKRYWPTGHTTLLRRTCCDVRRNNFVTQSTVQPVPTRHRRHACIKCGQLSQQTRRLDPMLFQCWSSAVGGGLILKQHWVKSSRLLGSTQVSVYTHPSPTIIFSPADQGTLSKTAGQSQAYYNTWNWERGTYDINHLHILTCEVAVSRVGSVQRRVPSGKWWQVNDFGCFSHRFLFWGWVAWASPPSPCASCRTHSWIATIPPLKTRTGKWSLSPAFPNTSLVAPRRLQVRQLTVLFTLFCTNGAHGFVPNHFCLIFLRRWANIKPTLVQCLVFAW